ncbi:MAG TPA: hypothetical protein VGH90_08960, partial [Chthoniobacteraceae bacterium]
MPRSDKFCLWIAAITFAGVLAADVRLSTTVAFSAAPFVLLFPILTCISIVKAITQCRSRGWRALIPLLACIVAFVSIRPVSRIALRIELARGLPSYEKIITEIKSGQIEVSDQLSPVLADEKAAWPAYAVLAEIEPDGSLYVEFQTGGAFPVKHSGFAYCSSDRLDEPR